MAKIDTENLYPGDGITRCIGCNGYLWPWQRKMHDHPGWHARCHKMFNHGAEQQLRDLIELCRRLDIPTPWEISLERRERDIRHSTVKEIVTNGKA